jgi:hypothetical protein
VKAKEAAILLEIDATLRKHWDPAKRLPFDQQAALQRIHDDFERETAAFIVQETMRLEHELVDAVCVRLTGEHGRIEPGTVLLETPGPRLGGKTQWLMPG